ncbi:MAG: helix-turn-helix domain-containing protein [Clostridia bacterium]|nr:helix-turn-helix domain-containing protein [Clostridia bacterium]
MTVGQRMRLRRRELGLTLEDVAIATETSKQTVQRYESGVIANIPRARLEAIAAVLRVPPAELLGWSEPTHALPHSELMPLSRRAVPLLGAIACGEPILAEEEFCGYELAGGDVDADFCLRAKGDSMIGARIEDGDIVFVRRQESVENGEIAVVIIDDEATLKRVYYDRTGEKLILTPENPRYAPLSFEGEELSRIKILGRAVALQSPLR